MHYKVDKQYINLKNEYDTVPYKASKCQGNKATNTIVVIFIENLIEFRNYNKYCNKDMNILWIYVYVCINNFSNSCWHSFASVLITYPHVVRVGVIQMFVFIFEMQASELRSKKCRPKFKID